MTKEKGLDRLYVEGREINKFRNLTIQSVSGSAETQPFKDLKDAFLWAVSLGVKLGRRIPLEGSKEGLVLWTYLSDDDKNALYLLAIAESGELQVIENIGAVQEIAEEYANAGIRILKQEIMDGPGDALWKLVSIARSNKD